ncbi:hypothetical protein ALC57_18349 [Trachymyrmex cornetzi]|uniref:Uncharacterized protein n=1 Tax=Trachymyrmex cornetzi TaxID=471704 RepID=A0A151IS78_9HYME|nr:hypothetical protein ALC57_18349 [Trachymyrmex cornetzi]
MKEEERRVDREALAADQAKLQDRKLTLSSIVQKLIIFGKRARAEACDVESRLENSRRQNWQKANAAVRRVASVACVGTVGDVGDVGMAKQAKAKAEVEGR